MENNQLNQNKKLIIDFPYTYPNYPNNKIRTSKYTPWNFIPWNLTEQLSKVPNLFFILMSFLQTIKSISITGGYPTMIPVLSVVIFLSMLKDFFEDYKRWKSDKKENMTETLLVSFVKENSKFIKIIKIRL